MFKSVKTIAALAVAVAALVGGPATASAATSFGADVNPDVQPSNAGQPAQVQRVRGQEVHLGPQRRLRQPRAREGPEGRHDQGDQADRRRPRQLQAPAGQGQRPSRRPRSSPRVRGSSTRVRTNPNADTYEVEKFDVNVPVHEGEQLAIATKQTSTLRCSSGGDNTLLYNPALKVGNALQSLGSDDGCWMLIEGVIK